MSHDALSITHRLLGWIDTHRAAVNYRADDERIDWLRNLPFVLLHLACLAVVWVGASPTAVIVCVVLFTVRMFAITAVYHRLLGHRAYTAPRWLVFLGALVANSSGQRGPLWWAAHHRLHHRDSDEPADAHSPLAHGLMHAHIGWFMTPAAFRTRLEMVPDLASRRELLFLDRFDTIAPLALAAVCFVGGELLHAYVPGLGTDGWQLLVWGFAISTVVLAHATFTVNSLCHTWGSQPYATADGSRNNWLIAILTLGEGWHNNHHRYPLSVRQGFRWWQYDPTWWALCAMQTVGLVSGLKRVPARIIAEAKP